MSLRGPAHQALRRARSASLMGRVGRVGRGTKVSFKNLHTSWVYRKFIYLLVDICMYILKNYSQHTYWFKIWYQVGVRGTLISKLPYIREFEILCSKLVICFSMIARCFEKTSFFFKSQKALFAKRKSYDIVRRTLIRFELRILMRILLIL